MPPSTSMPGHVADPPRSTLRVASEALAGLDAAGDRKVVGRAIWIGLWTWPSFTALDAYMCFVAYPEAPFRLFLVYRVLIELLFLGVYRASIRETANVVWLFRLLVVSFGAAALVIALMAIHLGGIRSPYMHGISIVALVWAALIPTHWRRGLPIFIHIGLVFPVVMGIGAALSPAARAAWITTDALIVFVSNYVFVLSSSILSIILSQLVWSAQQQRAGWEATNSRSGSGRAGWVRCGALDIICWHGAQRSS